MYSADNPFLAAACTTEEYSKLKHTAIVMKVISEDIELVNCKGCGACVPGRMQQRRPLTPAPGWKRLGQLPEQKRVRDCRHPAEI
jgi:ferredoxin